MKGYKDSDFLIIIKSNKNENVNKTSFPFEQSIESTIDTVFHHYRIELLFTDKQIFLKHLFIFKKSEKQKMKLISTEYQIILSA